VIGEPEARSRAGAARRTDWERLKNRVLLAIPAIGLVLGLGCRLAGAPDIAGYVWAAAIVPVLAALLADIALGLRRGGVRSHAVAAHGLWLCGRLDGAGAEPAARSLFRPSAG
jgi:hypothetical protein